MQPLANAHILSLKAGLTVALALFAVTAMGIQDQLSATFVGLVCVSPTVFTGIRRGVEQLTASVLGGVVTVALLTLLPRHPLTLGLAIAITVRAAFHVGYWRIYLVAGFTVLYLYILPFDTPAMALGQRLASVATGIASATLVNVTVGVFSYRGLFTRRLGMVRRALADACGNIAAAAGDPARAARAPGATDAVYAMLSALEPELGDFVREGEIRGRADPRRVFQEQARSLSRAAHYVKELAMLLEVQPHAMQLVPALEAIRAELRGETALWQPPANPEEWAADAERALLAARASIPLPGS